MQRLMKGSGAVEEVVRDDKKAYEAQLKSHLSGIPRMMATQPQIEEEQANLKHVQGMSLTDYAKQYIKPEELTGMMANSRYTGAADKKANTFEGSEAAFKQAIASAERELGTAILPTLTTWLRTLTAVLQENAPTITKFGEKLNDLAVFIGGITGKATEGVQMAQKVLGPDFKPIVNTALMGPANAVGMTIFEAILEHIKATSVSSKETADTVKATFGTQ
jgi:hypothetical protein